MNWKQNRFHYVHKSNSQDLENSLIPLKQKVYNNP